MTHGLAIPLATNGNYGFSVSTALPTKQEVLSEQFMAEISGGLNPIFVGFVVGLAVNIVTNPTGIPETARWYYDRARDALDFVAGDLMSGMADGMSNL